MNSGDIKWEEFKGFVLNWMLERGLELSAVLFRYLIQA